MADAHYDPTQPNAMIKVFIVDDDLYVRSSLSELLPRFGAFDVTGVLADGADAVAAALDKLVRSLGDDITRAKDRQGRESIRTAE